MLEYIAYSNKGFFRKKNQDRVMIDGKILKEGSLKGISQGNILAVVCDGVGGNNGGEVAAEIVANGFATYGETIANVEELKERISVLNQNIMNEQKNNDSLSGMATTASGLQIINDYFVLFNVGDTRIYRFVNSDMLRETNDQKICSEEYGGLFEYNNTQSFLTSYFGGSGFFCDPIVKEGSINDSSGYFLICSDGIYKNIDEKKIGEIIFEKDSLEEKINLISNLAIKNKFMDDASLILIKYKL